MAKKMFSFTKIKSGTAISNKMSRDAAATRKTPGKYTYSSTKKDVVKRNAFHNVRDDVLMDLGLKEKTPSYFANLDDRQKRSREAGKNLGKDIFGRPASDRRTVARGETAAERKATLLAERKAEGQKRRKKFYKQKDERLAKLKAKLLNLA
tara:strand:+ start:246 stop:698 length:453 start_codon:yes stop_codon:yes gene_type:complete